MRTSGAELGSVGIFQITEVRVEHGILLNNKTGRIYCNWCVDVPRFQETILFPLGEMFPNSLRTYRICRNKRPGRLRLRSNKTNFQTHQNPSVLYTPRFEKLPIKAHRFCVLPPLKNHPSKAFGFVYSPHVKNHCYWWTLISGGRLFRLIR